MNRLTVEEARARVRPSPVSRVPKSSAPPPVGKKNELWNNIYTAVLDSDNHELAEKMADSMLRARERALGQKRHSTIFVSEYLPNKLQADKKVAIAKSVQCQARTLENKQCSFKVTPGGGCFCKKHSTMI